jgi:HAE1 family hydrophobic/amphiphilic exporter-1
MNVHGGHHAFFAALVKRPVLLLTLLFTCVIIGVIAYARIPVQMMPDGIVDPGLQVFVTNPGSSAQENEERVARVLEAELRTLAGIEDIESSSRQDNVGIFVNFKSDTDMDYAKAEVRDRLERARPQLPTTVQEIGIWSWSESDLPVMFFALLHPGDSERTDFLVENVIQRHLEAVDGVGRIEMYGIADDSLRILLDEDRVKAANLDIGALIQRLSADNFAMPMGEVEDGGSRVLLRSDMRFKDPAEIEEYPVGNGLVLRDIARVLPVKSVRESLSRVDGKYAYWGEIQKDGQANVVETCHRLLAAIHTLEQDPALRGEFGFRILFNQGEFIENSLDQLRHTAVTGGLLAVVILFVFLWRVRLTLIVALSIPISVLLTIAWAYFTGGTFNVLTMTGMTLALGMLVDNSIVVVENITRLRAEGRPMTESIVSGTAEVGLAVVLSTLTVVVVFLPLIFMGENPSLRIILGELGLPLCVSLIVSLIVALIFLPVLVRGALGPRATRLQLAANRFAVIGALPGRAVGWCVGAVRALFHGVVRLLYAVCARVLAVAAPLRFVLAALVVAVAGWKAWIAWPAIESARLMEVKDPDPVALLAITYGVPTVFAVSLILIGLTRWRKLLAVPPTRPQRLVPATRSVLDLVIEGNQRLVAWSVTHRFAASVVMLLAFVSIVVPMNRMVVAAFGEDDSKTRVNLWVELEDNFTLAQAAAEMDHYDEFLESKRGTYHFDHSGNRFSVTGGRVSLYWDQPQKQEHMDFVLADLKRDVPRLPGHKLQFFDEVESGENRSRSVVTFRLHGPDSDELERYGTQAVELLQAVPGLSSVSSPLENAPKQVRIKFDSDLAQQLGVTPQTALENISWALRGVQLPRFQEPGREIPLIIEYDEENVAGLGTLRDLTVYAEQNAVPLSSFADLEFGQQRRAIYRRNGQVTFTIQAKVDNPARQRELSDAGLRALAAGLDLPRGYAIGEDDTIGYRQEEEMQELMSALLLGIVLVFLLMGILFESFLLPISVLFTIPYAILGSYWALYLTGTAMDSVGWIGIIILVGVEVNHGIVLIDRIHALRAEGMERTAAILEGCRNRVRPILMTALTAVMGLYPMAVTEPSGEGIDYRALATCVAGGLIVSTVFTLWVVPLAYSLLDDLANAVGARMRWSLRRRGAPLDAPRDVAAEPSVTAPAAN